MSADDLDLDYEFIYGLVDTDPLALRDLAWRLAREREALRAEVERLRAMEALRMAADAAMCAEIGRTPDD